MVLDSNREFYSVIPPSFINDTIVRCPLSGVSDQVFVPNQVMNVFLLQDVHKSVQIGNETVIFTQNFKSDYLNIQSKSYP
jgi:hypothetical protein